MDNTININNFKGDSNITSLQTTLNNLTLHSDPSQSIDSINSEEKIYDNINTSSIPPKSEIKFSNALDFLDKIKITFSEQPTVYTEFLSIMKDFKTKKINTMDVISRVNILFCGHDDLLQEFNQFLPTEYNTPLDKTNETKINKEQVNKNDSTIQSNSELQNARNYVKKIKERFETQPEIYKQFLSILSKYRKNLYSKNQTISDVYNQIAILFEHHPDLLDEFKTFLPQT